MARKKVERQSKTTGATPSRKPKPPKQDFVFYVPISFDVQHTFSPDDVDDPTSARPELTEKAAAAFGRELRAFLEQQYHVLRLEADEDSPGCMCVDSH